MNRRCTNAILPAKVSNGSTARARTTVSWPSSARRKTRTTCCWSAAISRRSSASTTAWVCPTKCGSAKSSTAIRSTTAAATWGTSRASEREPIEWHGRPWSIDITLPPLATVFLSPSGRIGPGRRSGYPSPPFSPGEGARRADEGRGRAINASDCPEAGLAAI